MSPRIRLKKQMEMEKNGDEKKSCKEESWEINAAYIFRSIYHTFVSRLIDVALLLKALTVKFAEAILPPEKIMLKKGQQSLINSKE